MARYLPPELTPAWTPPADVAALAPYEMHVIDDPADPLFAAAYDSLDGYFGALGQLEPRDAMARIVAGPRQHGGIWTAGPMAVVRDATDTILAAGSRFVTYEPESGLLCALDGCAWVAPAHRGRGLGPALVPVQFAAAQRVLAPFGALAPTEVVDLGDLEPYAPDDPVTMRRAVFWGRLGYRLLPSAAFPLGLVGMEDVAGGGTRAPVEMLAILRFPRASAPPVDVPKALLHRLVDHLAAAHAWTGEADPVQAPMHAAIEAYPEDPVRLLSLPTTLGG